MRLINVKFAKLLRINLVQIMRENWNPCYGLQALGLRPLLPLALFRL
jgi:hypothetical protein